MNFNSPQDWKAWAQAFPQKAESDAAYKSPFAVQNKTADSIEILIYDQIGRDFWSGEGMAAKDFSDLLKDVNPKATLTVGILSPGGNVWDGLGIAGIIERWQGHTITRNDGMAASIASVILMAGKERQSANNSLTMIHKAWGVMVGNADDATKFSADLAKYDKTISEAYAKRSGKPASDWLAAMEAETYYTAAEALSAGLLDKILTGDNGGKQNHASNQAHANLDAQTSTSQNSPITSPVASISSAVNPPPMNAVKPQQNKTMEPNTTTPAAAQPAAIDTNAILAAINGLGDKLKPAPALGAEPAAASHVVELGRNELVEKYENTIDPVEKAKFARAHYADARKQLMIAASCDPKIITAENRFDLHNPQIRNANTVDAALANTILAGDFVTTMRTYTAPWMAFTRSVTMSPVSKRQTLEVPLVSSAGSMQTNATNYESGDTTLAPIAVTTSEYSRSFHVTRPQTNLGLQLAALAPTNAAILGEGISGLFTALMTNANFGADVVIGAAADFSSTDLPAILALGKNYTKTTLVIDGGHLAYLLPTDRQSFTFGEPGAYGFDGGIYKNNLWTGGATDICGLVCGADAIVSAWGMAEGLPAGEAIAQSNIEVNGFPFSVTTWFSRATREVWSSFQIVGGVAAGDKTQAEVLTTQ